MNERSGLLAVAVCLVVVLSFACSMLLQSIREIKAEDALALKEKEQQVDQLTITLNEANRRVGAILKEKEALQKSRQDREKEINDYVAKVQDLLKSLQAVKTLDDLDNILEKLKIVRTALKAEKAEKVKKKKR